MAWTFWVIFGLGLLAFEVVTPGGFFTVFFGLSAFVIAIVSRLGVVESGTFQWVLFGMLGTVLILALRPLLRRRFETGTPKVDQLVGETALAVEDLPPQGRGKVELRGASWNAHYIGSDPAPKGARLRVKKVDGLSLVVEKE